MGLALTLVEGYADNELLIHITLEPFLVICKELLDVVFLLLIERIGLEGRDRVRQVGLRETSIKTSSLVLWCCQLTWPGTP